MPGFPYCSDLKCPPLIPLSAVPLHTRSTLVNGGQASWTWSRCDRHYPQTKLSSHWRHAPWPSLVTVPSQSRHVTLQVLLLSSFLRMSSCNIRSSFRCSALSSAVCSLAGGDGGAAEDVVLVFSASSAAIISITTTDGASACGQCN